MRALYLDLSMGIAGDMFTAALVELFEDKEAVVNELNPLGIPEVTFTLEDKVSCGVKGSHIEVSYKGAVEDEHMHEDHEEGHSHEHSSLDTISHIVKDHLKVSDKVKEDVLNVFTILAKAESRVHGVEMSDIHFHEVGTMDAIADITAVCYLMEKLGVEKVYASEINTGSGTVKCAHGILPVPAPATSVILEGIPVYSNEIRSELCTPTGAALAKYFVSKFGTMPVMAPVRTGYGMGKKDFEALNAVRAILGNTYEETGCIVELSTNVDDMTGEQIGYLTEECFKAGAVEVYTTAIGMKKNRPGTLISVMCKQEDREALLRCIFANSTTIGIRENVSKRYTLSREIVREYTTFGEIRKKVSRGYGVVKQKYEYDDLKRIADDNDMSIKEILDQLK